MTALDDKLLPAALAAIQSVGVSASYKQIARTLDPATNSVSESVTSHAVTVTPKQAYRQEYVDGTNVRAEDFYVFLAGSGLAFTPTQGDRIAIAGVDWQVVAVTPYESGVSVAAYKLQVRV